MQFSAGLSYNGTVDFMLPTNRTPSELVHIGTESVETTDHLIPVAFSQAFMHCRRQRCIAECLAEVLSAAETNGDQLLAAVCT